MTALPKQYQWLNAEPGPRILLAGLETFGTIEKPGKGSNPSILRWAKETGLEKLYRSDETAWCGLWMAYVTLQAGFEPPLNPLGARNWLNFGTEIDNDKAALGDVLVFWREKRTGFKGHVGEYVGEDRDAFHVLGGNQMDRVMIKRIPKTRLLGVRRCPWRINQPAAVRKILLAAKGTLSVNEA